tara:strand:- start:237 stop:1004 length:768 start_codon:yes stop_codon:yes gene_type:complete
MTFEFEVEKVLQNYRSNKKFNLTRLKAETFVENLRDWSELKNLGEIEQWFLEMKKNCAMEVNKIPLKDLRKWSIKSNQASIEHATKSFFSIIGLRISNTAFREVGISGWDQPILKEKNNNGGIVGIIRKKTNSIPYYLLEAKAEPGNPDIIQLSPCFQATYSNINQAHGGRKPNLHEIFTNTKKKNFKVLFNKLMSEDGGRLFKKKNRGMIIEVPEKFKIKMNENFIWLSLYQIKMLIKQRSWVNPHVRSLISHL